MSYIISKLLTVNTLSTELSVIFWVCLVEACFSQKFSKTDKSVMLFTIGNHGQVKT